MTAHGHLFGQPAVSWLLCIKFPVSSHVLRTMGAEASSDYGKASVVLADPRLTRNPLINRSSSESLVQRERQQRKVAGAPTAVCRRGCLSSADMLILRSVFPRDCLLACLNVGQSSFYLL